MGQQNTKLKQEDIQDLFNSTHFSKSEIQDWYKNFIKKCPQGMITLKQITKMYSEYFEGDAREFASHVFRTFDDDGNGVIDFREFLSSLSITSRGTLEEKLDWAFSIYDINGDGGISKEEMTKIILSIHKMYGDALKEKEPPLHRTERIFHQFDTNNDGVLSLSEFKDGARSDPFLVMILQYKPPRHRNVFNPEG